jgi:hypothetical protein
LAPSQVAGDPTEAGVVCMTQQERFGAFTDGAYDSPGRAAMWVPIDVDRLCLGAAATACVLAAIGVTTNLHYAFSSRSPDALQRYVDVNAEGNLPTWYSVVLLAACAAATCGIAQMHRVAGRRATATPWYALAALVAIMSLDEMTSLHEASGRVLRRYAEVPVLGKYAWILPGTVAAVLVGWVLVVAVRSMTAPARRALALAGALFVGAALGMEVLEALLLNDGRNYLGRSMHLLTGVQELLEMLGAVLFLRVTLREVVRLGGHT